jgi:hypothetical protein
MMKLFAHHHFQLFLMVLPNGSIFRFDPFLFLFEGVKSVPTSPT